ncbi:EF-hand domain-containing protein [Maridesulfovibrio sp.]|uniref:EF-hand domain-containing protein n=1 Tax=Maridesulfovibrio sp. TaxID=2795000 RepID=UPI002A18D82C|nr:EF-hand domain-containing protein [Maridesulfovibrio sp.]
MNQTSIKRPEDYDSSEDFVSSIIGDNDSDGDGQLSVDEAGFLEDIFSEIDADGDGYLSQEEMVSDLENRQQQMAMMGQMSVMMQGGDGSDLIDTLMSELDSDGDSLISQEESGLDDELFSTLDTDGDGSISSEELQAGMTPPDVGMVSEGVASASSSGSSESSSSSSESEEDYDEFDYNKDGVVSFSELEQAYASGETSLEDIVGKSSANNQQENENGQSGQSVLQRMAMQAYQEQTGAMYTGESLGALV